MPTFLALTYTAEVDWSAPEYAEGLREYAAFAQAYTAVLRGGHALYPSATAKTVTVPTGGAQAPVVSDGPYVETKEALTGFFLLECADLAEALAVAAQIPAARYGTVEVRQVHPSLGI